MLAVGLMSGTSCDGVDAALVEFTGEKVTLKAFLTVPYSPAFKAKLLRNLHLSSAKLDEIAGLHYELGERFCAATEQLLKEAHVAPEAVAFVASHGQTIWHEPPVTFQIGEAAVISYRLGIKTIANFRALDVIAGGEGAPLVPLADWYLYRNDRENLAFQNIGGISNVTYLPKGKGAEAVVAFDTGVGNAILDYFAEEYFGAPYDDDGKHARSGKVITKIYNELIKDPFLLVTPPKSTGRELYTKEYFAGLAQKHQFARYAKNDILATLTEYVAYMIGASYKKYLGPIDKVIVTGGGSHNSYLIERIKAQSACEKVMKGEDCGINSDAKEAVAFAVLGYLTVTGKAGNAPAATGAKEALILGQVVDNPHLKK